MARSFLTAINLNKNELQNAAVQNLGAAPASPVKGQLYFNSTGGDNTLYWWDGTTWIPAKATGGAFPGYGSVPAETTFGITKNDGAATTVARSDHTHGSPLHDNAAHSAVNLNALAVPTGPVSMNSQKLTGLATPTSGGDAANKNYVDNFAQGLSWKEPVRVASTGNLPLSGLAAIDGVTPAAGERVLAKDQTTPSSNGVYLAAAGGWFRDADADQSADLEGMAMFVLEGTVNADTAWVCTTNAPIVVGTTPLTFVQFAGGGSVTAGAGMTQTGNVLNVISDATMVVTADQISQAPLTGDVTTPAGSNAATIATGVVTNAKLAIMPGSPMLKGRSTIGTGIVEDINMVTLQTMVANFLARFYQAVVGGATSAVVTHNLNTFSVMVSVFRNSAPFDTVECDVERTTANTVTLRFATAPAASEYAVVVVG